MMAADRFIKDSDAATLFSISRSSWWLGVKEKTLRKRLETHPAIDAFTRSRIPKT